MSSEEKHVVIHNMEPEVWWEGPLRQAGLKQEKETKTSRPTGLTSACILSSFLRGRGETNTQWTQIRKNIY